MICRNGRINPLTGHRSDTSENLTAMAENPLTGHRKKRQRNSDSWVENPLTGHRNKHSVIRQESGGNEMVTFRPSRDSQMYRNNSTRLVFSVQSMGMLESRDVPSREAFSIFTERNTVTRGLTPIIASPNNSRVVTNANGNRPMTESQVSLYRRPTPRRSLSLRSERSSFYDDRYVPKPDYGNSSERSLVRSLSVRSRPSSSYGVVCSRRGSVSTDRTSGAGILGRGQLRFDAGDEMEDNIRESVESLEPVPLESAARLESEKESLDNSKTKKIDRKRKTPLTLNQTKAMIQSFGNRLRKSLRRSKSNLETRSKPELRNTECDFNIVEKSASRPASFHYTGNTSPDSSCRLKSTNRPSSTSALSKYSEDNPSLADFEASASMKSVSLKNVHRNSVSGSSVSDKTLRRSFLRHSKNSLNASKEAIKNTYVNLVAPVKCLSKDDSRLEDIARSKENTRKSIRHANSNLDRINMKEPVIIQSTNSLERRRNWHYEDIQNSSSMLKYQESKSPKKKLDISSLTIKRLEDKPSGRGRYDVMESYIPENENLSTFNGLKLCSIQDISSKGPTLLPSYRPPPMNSEPISLSNSNKSISSKKRNSSDVSVSSFEDNETQPRVNLPCNLKRRARVTKRPSKKRANTESFSNGELQHSTTTTAEISLLANHLKDSEKRLSPNEQNEETLSINPSPNLRLTDTNTPNSRSLESTLERRRKFRKGVHEPIPVPPPVPGKLKPNFSHPIDNNQSNQSINQSNQSISNLNHSDGLMTPTSLQATTPRGELSLEGLRVTSRSSGSDMSESGSTPTPTCPVTTAQKQVSSRPVSGPNMASNSSNDMCINFEMLLKEILSRRMNEKMDSTEDLPTS